jgi:hypothetical protein
VLNPLDVSDHRLIRPADVGRCVHATTVPQAGRDRVRGALAVAPGRPESRAPRPQPGTRRRAVKASGCGGGLRAERLERCCRGGDAEARRGSSAPRSGWARRAIPIPAIDRLHKPERGHLDEVLDLLRRAPVAQRERTGERQVAFDQRVARLPIAAGRTARARHTPISALQPQLDARAPEEGRGAGGAVHGRSVKRSSRRQAPRGAGASAVRSGARRRRCITLDAPATPVRGSAARIIIVASESRRRRRPHAALVASARSGVVDSRARESSRRNAAVGRFELSRRVNAATATAG